MLANQRAFSQYAASSASPRVAAPGRVSLNVVARESRIGGKPIPVPKGTTVTIDGLTVKAKVGGVVESQAHSRSPMQLLTHNTHKHTHTHLPQGPNGSLQHTMTPYVKLEQVRCVCVRASTRLPSCYTLKQ